MKILEFFTGSITIFDNPLCNWIFGGLATAFSGSIAFFIGGKLGYNGKSGLLLWLITAVLVYAFIAVMTRFILWLASLPWWIWIVVICVTIVIVVLIVLLCRKHNKNE